MKMGTEMTEVELAGLAEKIGVPSRKDEEALEQTSKSSPITFAQARKVYDNSPDGSEEGKQALKRWGELAMIEVGKITTIAQARKVYDNSPDGSEAREKALVKWFIMHHYGPSSEGVR